VTDGVGVAAGEGDAIGVVRGVGVGRVCAETQESDVIRNARTRTGLKDILGIVYRNLEITEKAVANGRRR
jgi:hypothetical protein